MKALVLALLLAATAAGAQVPRGTVVTDTLWSQALAARKSAVVYLPPSYQGATARRYPVAYYLHGRGGDETNWTGVGGIAEVMDSLAATGMPEMIIVMPDGDNSWYATSNLLLDAAGCRRMLRPTADPERDCVAWPHYDDYIATDLVQHVDAKYRTAARRERRAVAGLSMGGYGAFTLALQYPATFGAAASHSGVLWPRELAPAPVTRRLEHSAADSVAIARFNTWPELRVVFGTDSAGWVARDPAAIAARRRAAGQPLPALYADCGVADVFLAQNRAFRDAMAARDVPLDYHEWPGSHSWAYWRAHVGESLKWIASRIAAPDSR